MKLRKLLLVAAFSVATGTTVRSASPVEPDLPAGASLEQTITFALANNPGVHAAEARWRAAIAKVPQARGWPDPKLNYGYFAENVETRVGPQEHRIGVTQPLPWFGKLRAAGDVASAEAAAVLADFAAAQLEVVRDVKSAWFELAWLNEAQRITADNTQLVKQLEAVAQTRLRAGGDLGAVTKAQVELGRLEDRFASLDDLREPLGARLNAVLNRPSAGPLPAIVGARTNDVTLPSLSDLVARQMELNPMLDQLAHRIRREEHASRLARKAGMPEFGLGVDYVSVPLTSISPVTVFELLVLLQIRSLYVPAGIDNPPVVLLKVTIPVVPVQSLPEGMGGFAVQEV
jgi:outer membrane protein TolC